MSLWCRTSGGALTGSGLTQFDVTTGFSFSCWLFGRMRGNTGAVVYQHRDTTAGLEGVLIGVNSNGNLYLRSYDASTSSEAASAFLDELTTAPWSTSSNNIRPLSRESFVFQVGLSWNGSRVTWYYNGLPVESTSLTRTATTGGNRNTSVLSATTAESLGCSDLRIWTMALTSGEMNAVYRGLRLGTEKGIFCLGPVAEINYVPNGPNLTYVNGTNHADFVGNFGTEEAPRGPRWRTNKIGKQADAGSLVAPFTSVTLNIVA
jgi:hypothetical protein